MNPWYKIVASSSLNFNIWVKYNDKTAEINKVQIFDTYWIIIYTTYRFVYITIIHRKTVTYFSSHNRRSARRTLLIWWMEPLLDMDTFYHFCKICSLSFHWNRSRHHSFDLKITTKYNLIQIITNPISKKKFSLKLH